MNSLFSSHHLTHRLHRDSKDSSNSSRLTVVHSLCVRYFQYRKQCWLASGDNRNTSIWNNRANGMRQVNTAKMKAIGGIQARIYQLCGGATLATTSPSSLSL